MEDEKEFDLDSLQAEWEKEWQEEDTDLEDAEETDVEESEEDLDETLEDEGDSDDEEDSESDEEESQDEEQSDEKEQPQTNEELELTKRQLQELQRQLAETKRTADVFDEIAKQSGVSREELLKQYEQSKLAEEAKAQNVPVEFLEKQRQMERELQELRDSQFRKEFNSSVTNLKTKYNLQDSDIKSTLDYAYTNGIDAFNPAVNLEEVYKLANFDKLVEQKVKESRQKELEAKQKRMKSATVTHDGSQGDTGQNLDDEVRNFLKEVL